MSELELLLREIKDQWTRENFSRLVKYIQQEKILQGEWQLYELRFDAGITNYRYPHKLKFIPQDIILLQVIGDRNVEFNHDKFTRVYLDITVQGPVFVRFLAGRFKDKILSAAARKDLANVSVGAPGGTTGPLAQVIQNMTCDASLVVNDWVYQSPTISNRAIKNTDNTAIYPTIGLVKTKTTSTTADILLFGLYTGLSLSGRGLFRLGTGGTATFSVPTTGFIQNLGISFGNGTIHVSPDWHRIERTP